MYTYVYDMLVHMYICISTRIHTRECVRARELERERTRVRAREKTCMQEAAQQREAAGACEQKTVKKIRLPASKK